MNVPSAESLLRVWEDSSNAHAIVRALNLLAAASPDIGREVWAVAPIGERDGCLLELYEALFGQRLHTVTHCPRCDLSLESSFATREIRGEPATWPPRGMLMLRAGDYSVEYRLPNSDDLLRVSAMDDADEARIELLRRCIGDSEVAGKRQNAETLPPAVVAHLSATMARQDPAADVQVELSCPACGHTWNACFDIISYFWSELDDWAPRVLADVDMLARTYGWSEREILNLSPTRRRHYLELVRA